MFWDEIYALPFFNVRLPKVTRGLLMYRYRRVGEARAAAREAGFRGAIFPWQSGSEGIEETQRVHLNPVWGRWEPDLSRNQRHVNAALDYFHVPDAENRAAEYARLFTGNEGVVVLAATNRADVLDPALLRPGRFDRRVTVSAPDQRGRRQIPIVHTRGVPPAPGVDLGAVAAQTPGMVGADLANLVNEAALLAARRGENG